MTKAAMRVVVRIVDDLVKSSFVKNVLIENRLEFRLEPRLWRAVKIFMKLKIGADCSEKVFIILLEDAAEASVEPELCKEGVGERRVCKEKVIDCFR